MGTMEKRIVMAMEKHMVMEKRIVMAMEKHMVMEKKRDMYTNRKEEKQTALFKNRLILGKSTVKCTHSIPLMTMMVIQGLALNNANMYSLKQVRESNEDYQRHQAVPSMPVTGQ